MTEPTESPEINRIIQEMRAQRVYGLKAIAEARADVKAARLRLAAIDQRMQELRDARSAAREAMLALPQKGATRARRSATDAIDAITEDLRQEGTLAREWDTRVCNLEARIEGVQRNLADTNWLPLLAQAINAQPFDGRPALTRWANTINGALRAQERLGVRKLNGLAWLRGCNVASSAPHAETCVWSATIIESWKTAQWAVREAEAADLVFADDASADALQQAISNANAWRIEAEKHAAFLIARVTELGLVKEEK